MPVTTGRKAIRFKSIDHMQRALDRDEEYQHRHLVFECLMSHSESCTRRQVSDEADIPINSISKVVSLLIKEGALVETGKMACPSSGRNIRGIAIHSGFKGPY